MDSITLLAISQVILSMAVLAGAHRRESKSDARLLDRTFTVTPGAVIVVEATRPVSSTQYPKLRAYLDDLEKHSGAKFVLIDGALRVAAVRCSE